MRGLSVLLASATLLAGAWAGEACTEGELMEHADCDKFYKCDYGVPVAMQCPDGLLYDHANEWCSWSWDVDCGGRNLPDSSEAAPKPDSSEVSSREVEWLPNGCPDDNKTPHLMQHERCDKFYLCDSGVPYPKDCPPGLLYDPSLERCEWSWDVDCTGRHEGDPAARPPAPEEAPEPRSEENNAGSGGDGAVDAPAPGTCPEDSSKHTLIAHETDSGLFYYCDGGKRILTSCGPGLVFNANLQVCDWP